MRVVVIAIGAVVLTGLLTVYQMPTLIEGIQGGAETSAGLSALPDVSSPPPGHTTAVAGDAQASANAATNSGLPDLIEGDVASSKSPRESEDVADSVRLKRLRAALVDRSSGRRSRAAEELGEAGDRNSIHSLESMARRDPSSTARLSAVEALGELDATGALADIVSDPDASEETKVEAIEEIVDTNEPLDFDAMTTDALLSALDDPNSAVYEEAASWLTDVEDPWFISQLWARFEQYAQIDYDRAEVMLDLLEYFDEDVDEPRELLDYYDGVDWDAIVRRQQESAWANGVCYFGAICS